MSDNVLRDVTKERDSALSQLGIAYVTIEQLKSERAQLIDENQELKLKLGPNSLDRKDEPQNDIRKGQGTTSADRRQLSGVRNREQSGAIVVERPPGAPIGSPKRQTKLPTKDKGSKLRFEERLAAHPLTNAQTRKLTDGISKHSAKNDDGRLPRHEGTRLNGLIPNAEQTERSVDFAESEGSEGSDVEHTEESAAPSHEQQILSERGDQTQNTTRDITYLSFMDVS